jgi:rhamnosyltransferase
VAPASAIVRTRDSADTLERALTGLREQTVPVEIVVVDSGSTDGTLEIARRGADRVIEIAPHEFTYGHALNLGAAQAGARVHFALSSHCVPPARDWVERSLAHYDRAEVAATSGYHPPGPGGRSDAVMQDIQLLRADPYWGYSNTAGSWRAELWERFPFDERLEAAEDREWSWRVLEAGYVVAMDPALEVISEHRRSQGLRDLYRRQVRESRVIAGLEAGPTPSVREAFGAWWDVSPPPGRSAVRVRSSPWHIAAALGRYVGARSARRTP